MFVDAFENLKRPKEYFREKLPPMKLSTLFQTVINQITFVVYQNRNYPRRLARKLETKFTTAERQRLSPRIELVT